MAWYTDLLKCGRNNTYDTRYSDKGSGNVFRDLGFSEEKSAELTLKSSLLQALQETIKERGWKQVEAATQLGVDQAKGSKLLAGQMAGFSIERLVNFLSLLGSIRQFCAMKRRLTLASAPEHDRRTDGGIAFAAPFSVISVRQGGEIKGVGSLL